MIIWYGIGCMAAALIIGLLLCTLGYRWACQDGYQTGLFLGQADRAQRELDQRQQARHEARHARTQPRERKPDHTPRRQQDVTPETTAYAKIPAAGADDPMQAATLPGPGSPQPARDSGDGTDTFPRYGSVTALLGQLDVKPQISLPATTGEIRAIGEAQREQNRADNDAWLEQWSGAVS